MIRTLTTGLIAALIGLSVTAHAQSPLPPLRLVDESPLRLAADSAQDRPTHAAFCSDGRVLVAFARPARIALYAGDGTMLWSRSIGPVEGIRCGYTEAGVLTQGDAWELHTVALSTGRTTRATTVSAGRADVPELLGWTGSGWAVVVKSSMTPDGPAVARIHPEFAVWLYSPRLDAPRAAFARTDSSPQIIPALGASPTRRAIRPPFAPVVGWATASNAQLLYSDGRSYRIDILDQRGRRLNALALDTMGLLRSAKDVAALVATWDRTFAAVWPDSLRQRAIALHTGGRDAIVGRVYACRGRFLVERRDWSVMPLRTDGEITYDVFDETLIALGRVRVPDGTELVDCDGDRVLLLRSDMSALGTGTARTVVLARVQR